MKRIQKQFLFALAAAVTLTTTGRAADIARAETRAIAKETYIYGYPMVNMLPQLKKDADGGLTLLIQNESPGKDKEAN